MASRKKPLLSAAFSFAECVPPDEWGGFFIIVCPGTSTHHIPVARQRGQTIQLLTFPLQLTFHGK
jgi:hypothetical protein